MARGAKTGQREVGRSMYITSPFNPLLHRNEFTFSTIPTTGFVTEKVKEAAAPSKRESDQPVAKQLLLHAEQREWSGGQEDFTRWPLWKVKGTRVTITSYTHSAPLCVCSSNIAFYGILNTAR